ncbi:MAG: hypothetical protein P4L83_18995 [Nevskia sp.]|nr:hypothetical protein [Nevskia sp.]
MDNRYYVRPHDSPDLQAGVAELHPSQSGPVPLELGVTFKSDGKVSASASDALYEAVRKGITEKGRWNVQRLGGAGDDFTTAVAAALPAAGAADPPQDPAVATAPQRLLVLVENSPDLSFGTWLSYFVSGMTYGADSVQHVTDRYDVTIRYRGGSGEERVYRSAQDMVFATGSKTFGRSEEGLEGLKHYPAIPEAFENIVDNSVNGLRRGTASVGLPGNTVTDPPAP